MQATLEQAHRQLRGIGAQCGIERGLHIGGQVEQVVVVGQRGGSKRHGAGDPARAQIDGGAKAQVGAGKAAGGQLGKAVGQDLFLPGRQHDGDVARGAELDLAVLTEGLQTGVAAEHHAVVQPGLGHRGCAVASAAAHVQQLAGHQALAQVHLALGQYGDFRVALVVNRLAAQEGAGGVLIVHDLAAGHHQAVDVRIAQGLDDDA